MSSHASTSGIPCARIGNCLFSRVGTVDTRGTEHENKEGQVRACMSCARAPWMVPRYVSPSSTLFSPHLSTVLMSWLPERLRLSFAQLPQSLLLVLLAALPFRIPDVSALQGDSWCGTLMCVSATVNASTVTCAPQ
ncbi:hypothetical protein C8Q80DRAFT_700276 [Daedaleopsis nitida]|nr:hypothetical protein C8Q80DRAFT_700276 [Daedaleopsis nitida]